MNLAPYSAGRTTSGIMRMRTSCSGTAIYLPVSAWNRKNHRMNQPPDQEAAVADPSDKADWTTTVLLAEYAALRAELERRAGVQWNVVALQITSAGVVASLALSQSSHNALLLLLPLSSYVFGNRYVLHDYHMKLISRYIQESLSARLDGHLQWEAWKQNQMKIGMVEKRSPSAVSWNVLHPTRLVFEGVAFFVLVAAALAGTVAWLDKAPAWQIMVGLSCLWVLGVFALGALDVSFRRSS